jgi:plasmid stability protein
VKNITVSVDDHLYQQARIRAAQRSRSVSALVREFLAALVEEDTGFERLQREQNDLIARIRAGHPGFAAADRLTRDEVHDRHALR